MLWLIPAFAFVVQQMVAMGRQQSDRDVNYDAAMAAARSRGKPLLVVGGPWGTSLFRRALNYPAHGHGDVCFDLDERSCREAHFVPGDARDLPFPDKSFGAAFCSHLLEHMPTPEACFMAASEMERVADEVFLCVPKKDNLLAWLAPGHRLWVEVDQGRVMAVEVMKAQRVVD